MLSLVPTLNIGFVPRPFVGVGIAPFIYFLNTPIIIVKNRSSRNSANRKTGNDRPSFFRSTVSFFKEIVIFSSLFFLI